jgi:stage II sporulation protein P
MESENSVQSYQVPESGIISSALNYMFQSNLPILEYVDNKDNTLNQKNRILNAMTGVFPINRYIADVEASSGEQKIEENEDTMFASEASNSNLSRIMPIDIIQGDIYSEQGDYTGGTSTNFDIKETLGPVKGEHFTVDQLLNRSFLFNNFYIVDQSTKADDNIFDAEKLMKKDMTMELNQEKPQILIYHTHSRETYSDSRAGVEEDTIVGVGTYLTEILTNQYGYQVIHDTTQYDMINGQLDRNLAYNNAEPGIEKILEDNPTIEVVIDLHRDGAKAKRVTKINGKKTAQLMFFNGLSKNSKGEDITYLANPNLQDNLAFSLQLQLKGREMYPGLMYKNYLKAYRYNLHVRPKSILVETGTDYNTLEEAKNAMELLADILHEVLAGES